MKEALGALYELQLLDTAIDTLRRRFSALDRGAAEQNRYHELKQSHEEAATALLNAETSMRDTELEREAADDKRQREESRLYSGAVTSPRELASLQEEVEMLKRQTSRLEDKLMSILSVMESARRRELDMREALAEATEGYQDKIDRFNLAAAALKSEAQELLQQRKAAAGRVRPDLLDRYEAVRRARGGVAVAAVEDGTCRGCNMRLPSNVLAKVHEGAAIILCENCGRMLYELEKVRSG